MRLVLGTNVLVSGVRTPMGPPGQLLDLVLAAEIELVMEPRVAGEYRDVLLRPRFGFDVALVDRLLDALDDCALHVAALPWSTPLPDRSGEILLATAFAAQAVLVTGNTWDFPPARRHGVTVQTPRQCLDALRER